MVGNDAVESNENCGFGRRMSLALQLHRRDGCPESGILPYREIDDNIKRRRTSQPASSRHGAAAESHQTRPRSATQAPCRARQARSGKKASSAERRPKSQNAAKQAKPAASTREGSRVAKVLGLLRQPDGASLKELMKATGWLAHSVRGFLSGTISKKTNIDLVSAKNKHGERRYSVQG
jgi:hypothetical protein